MPMSEYVAALGRELAAYVAQGRTDRARQVRAELARVTGTAESVDDPEPPAEHAAETTTDLTAGARPRRTRRG